MKKTEYVLGMYSKDMFAGERDSARKAVDEAAAAGIGLKKPRKKRVESMNMPYFELIMKDGTLCDLNGLPRKTRVHYVCYPSGECDTIFYCDFCVKANVCRAQRDIFLGRNVDLRIRGACTDPTAVQAS